MGRDGDDRVGGPDRLARRLTTTDAVVIGMGSMIGAGIFAALRPAAQVAGASLLIGLAVAAVVAYCNATSSAQLAAVYPESGGTYVYAFTLPAASVLSGLVVLAIGAVVWLVRRDRSFVR